MLTNRTKDITNQRFGSLVAIKPTHKINNMMYWDFTCDCGKTHNARANTIAHQAKKNKEGIPSCGCVELSNKTKHGFRTKLNTHPAYRVYRGIMSRCYDSNNPMYKWYGAKGVTVCDEWKNNPEAFVKWAISTNYIKGLHIDKDILCKEKNISPTIYSPETCQWVTAKENVGFATNRNNFGKHPNIKLSNEQVVEIERLYFSGEITNKSELARMFKVKSPSSINRLIKIAEERAECSDSV